LEDTRDPNSVEDKATKDEKKEDGPVSVDGK